jgi:hypothetical protein
MQIRVRSGAIYTKRRRLGVFDLTIVAFEEHLETLLSLSKRMAPKAVLPV